MSVGHPDEPESRNGAASMPSRLRDREHAARLLAARLLPLRGQHPLILAVPRGALPMGRVIADALHGELDVVLAHKLGAPGNPELAIGAVDESGRVHLDDIARALAAGSDHLHQETDRQLAALRRRAAHYRAVRPAVDPGGRVVVVVDDGAATGATLLAALTAARMRNPRRLIAAAGVVAADTCQRLRELADEVVCVLAPPHLRSVGEHFDDFAQVGDDEALAALAAPESAGPRHR